jgi:hypothetical protein
MSSRAPTVFELGMRKEDGGAVIGARNSPEAAAQFSAKPHVDHTVDSAVDLGRGVYFPANTVHQAWGSPWSIAFSVFLRPGHKVQTVQL